MSGHKMIDVPGEQTGVANIGQPAQLHGQALQPDAQAAIPDDTPYNSPNVPINFNSPFIRLPCFSIYQNKAFRKPLVLLPLK